jgi:hypothetical protein
VQYLDGMLNVMSQVGPDEIEKAIKSRQVTEIMSLIGKQIFNV